MNGVNGMLGGSRANGAGNPRRWPRIGVFDSGFGGLTVLRALLDLLPEADYLYLGDTARLPYGSKSRQTIARYALSSARFLYDHGAEFLVIACNTASALALGEISEFGRHKGLPVMGVIEAGVEEARRATRSGDVLVIGTEATVGSHAYAAAGRKKGLRVIEKACPLLAPLVEEGWIDHPVTRQVVGIYLDELMRQAEREHLQADTLVLGCTHYPLIRQAIEQAVPGHVRVIDSAGAMAAHVAKALDGRIPPGGPGESDGPERREPGHRDFFATDSVEKFQSLGARFLKTPIDKVQLVDLEENQGDRIPG